jgi:hypothetical protein
MVLVPLQLGLKPTDKYTLRALRNAEAGMAQLVQRLATDRAFHGSRFSGRSLTVSSAQPASLKWLPVLFLGSKEVGAWS